MKKYKIILKETEITEYLRNSSENFHLYLNKDKNLVLSRNSIAGYVPQHLYVLSDRIFKNGDKLTHSKTGQIHTFLRYENSVLVTNYKDEVGTCEDWTQESLLVFIEQCIASTDKLFTDDYLSEQKAFVGIPPKEHDVKFPNKNKAIQIPDLFVETYIESYNNRKQIFEIYLDDKGIISLSKTYTIDDIRLSLFGLYDDGRLEIHPYDNFDEWFDENIG